MKRCRSQGDQVAPPRRGARKSVPQGHLIVAHYEVVENAVKDGFVPGTIGPSGLGLHTASRAQAANRSSPALAGRIALEKTRPTTS
jgi:hypothetical protein